MDGDAEPVLESRRKRARMSLLVDITECNIITSPDNKTLDNTSGVRRSGRLRRRSSVNCFNEINKTSATSIRFLDIENIKSELSVNQNASPVHSAQCEYEQRVPGYSIDVISDSTKFPQKREEENKENNSLITGPVNDFCSNAQSTTFPVADSPSPALPIPGWLQTNYVPPSLRGLETIHETSLSTTVHEAACPTRKYLSRTRRPPNESFSETAPQPALLRIQSFNDAATIEEVRADPTSTMAKFHLAAARARTRRQRAMLRKLKKRPQDVVAVSEDTERRFQAFLLATAAIDFGKDSDGDDSFRDNGDDDDGKSTVTAGSSMDS